ncbi:hypothetical protein D9M71_832590 [compost metagenome]
MTGDGGVHLPDQLNQIYQYLQHIHFLRPDPRFRRLQSLAQLSHAAAQPLNALHKICANRGIQLLPHNQIQIASGCLVQVIHAGQAHSSPR